MSETTELMDVEELFQKSDFVKESGLDWEEVYNMVHNFVTTTDEWRILRSHNTLFLLNLQGNKTAGVTIINSDTPENFENNVRECIEACKKADITHLIFNVKGRLFGQLVRRLGYEIKETALYQDEEGATTYQGDIYV
jgi:hypothetical protein